ncbi:MAG TPA: porin family protein [Candidatus Krumholzibacteria bacterium]|nr:porin family protein [Candidatus Krumholzibacteria bacterium]
MKPLAFIMVVALLAGPFAGPAAAQTTWSIGFKGGVSLADFGGDDIDSDATEARTAFAGGFFAQADVAKNFGVRVEGLYHMRGAVGETDDLDGSIKLDYIEFPILLLGQVPATETVTLSAFAGPVLAVNAKADAEGSSGGFSATVDIQDYVSSFEFAMAFGLGVVVDAGSVRIIFDGRYQLGLTTVDDGLGELLGAPDELDIKNQGWVFMAGVGFPVGGD